MNYRQTDVLRTAATLLAVAIFPSLPVAGGEAPHWTKPYNVVWTEPGTRGLDSMPAGGGNIGLNVWATTNAVLFYIGSPDSFDANEVLTKLARVRVTVSPNPFAASLRQELDLESNTVLVSGCAGDGTAVSLRIWADTHQPVVHVEGTGSTGVQVTATLELDANWSMTAGVSGNRVLWSRRVPAPSVFRNNLIAAWGMQAIAAQIPDPLSNLTCGGALLGAGFAPGAGGTGTNEGRACSTLPVATVAPVTNFAVRAVLRMAQDATADAWTNAVNQLATQTETTQAADRETSAAWWRAFWDRSRIVVNPDVNDPNDPAWQAGRNYQLFRAIQAANSTGKFPTFFNGGFFLCHADPESRAWAFCRFMGQNQRHVYWPLLKSGDADMLKVGTDFYARNAESRRVEIQYTLGIDGVIYNESVGTMGLGTSAATNGLSPMYPYYYTAGLEFALMMIEAHRYFGADLTNCLPVIEGAARYFDAFYRNENKKRTGSELNAQGQLVLFPANACESDTNMVNATDSLSGLIALSEAVLALSDGTVPEATRSYFQGFRAMLPPIATGVVAQGSIMLVDYRGTRGPIGNGEFPELCPVFPFGLYGVGKPGLDMARNTWTAQAAATAHATACGCWWPASMWVARLGLTEAARNLNLTKLRFPVDYNVRANGWLGPKQGRTRFPALYDGGGGVDGSGPCDTPDMDHGGSAMTGLQDMLLQTDGNRILLLPAWPQDWDVDFKLHAPWQTTVEGSVRGGALTSLTVTPASRRADVEIQAPYRNPVAPFVLPVACAMTNPATLALIGAGSNLTLAATASVAQGTGTVQKVEFFRDGVKMGEAATPPYSCVWSGVPKGVYAVTARATESGGWAATSQPVFVVATTDGAWEGVRAEGGTTNYYIEGGTNWTAHVFTNSGTFGVKGAGAFEYLVVAGGGGGGGTYDGGGGGGGGLLAGKMTLAAGDYTVHVGAGGTGEGLGLKSNGGDSVIARGGTNILRAVGGGYGASSGSTQGLTAAASGGSGGGGGHSYAIGTGTAGPPRQGYDGGAAGLDQGSGGGGGAGGPGQSASSATIRSGGPGLTFTMRDGVTAVAYAAGGAGRTRPGTVADGYITFAHGNSKKGNTGEGGDGGGGSAMAAKGGNGGPGIVIVRWVTGGGLTYTITYDGNGATGGAPPPSQIKTQDVAVVVADNGGNLAKSGYAFAGWNTATNGSGTDYVPGATYSANASVTLYAKWMAPAAPSITAQPADVAACAGQRALFSVTATGPVPLFYQWYRNGAAIGGAVEANYTTARITTNDSGATFAVTVTNSYGAVTSRVATLTVSDFLGAVAATGGTVTNYTLNGIAYRAHIFTNNGTFAVTSPGAVEYLVIGGGGGACSGRAGGGGAGGYRSSVQGEMSGGGSTAEAVYFVYAGMSYPVVVGTGGVAGVGMAAGGKGGDSGFADVVAMGGGGGKERNSAIPEPNADGGSGGGGGYDSSQTDRTKGGSGAAGQGYAGGNAGGNSGSHGFAYSDAGGGGGAGGPGANGANEPTPDSGGGPGLESSITGVAVKRAGGGQGAYGTGTSAGKAYGGGDQSGVDGTANTGGGGAGKDGGPVGNGGSGVVILRYAVPAITVSDTSHTFDDALVNATGTWTYTVSGSGLSDNLTISAPSPFTIATNGGTFGAQVVLTPAGRSVPATTINVHFSPTEIQAYAGTITNASAGIEAKLVALTGNGIAVQPVLTVAPTALGLGNVITNKTSTNATYTLSGVQLTGDVTVSAPACFTVSTNTAGPFAASCVVGVTPPTLPDTPIYVRFTPSAGSGPYAGSITNSSAGAANKLVAVTGTGVVQTLAVSPASLNFGTVGTSATSNLTCTVSGSNLEADVTVTVSGAGFQIKTNGGASFGTSVTLAVPNQSQPAGGTLAAQAIVVQFAPAAAQAYSAPITAASVGAANKTATLSGTGVLQQISVQQPAGTPLTDGSSTIDFGSAPGASKTFVVTNTATVVLTLTGITKDGAHPGDFTVGGALPTSLAAGASTTFTVMFTPTANGARSAGLHIGNGAGDGAFDIALTGAALAGRYLAFGGDRVTIVTNYPGTATQVVYGVHQYTNVGSAYFSPIRNLNVQYLVIGGGGGAGGARAGGGGAGGYRCSVPGELSGSNTAAEAVYAVTNGVIYPIYVGAGGAGSTGSGSNGGDSWFTNIVAIGGGRSSRYSGALTGGSGGGGSYPEVANANLGAGGTAGQGFKGGNAGGDASSHGYANSDGGGGGGAGGPGANGATEPAADSGGGTGLVSSITGTPVGRAGGGQGAYGTGTSPGAAYGGGLGGQGTGSAGTPPYVAATPGAPNTGGGGGGGADVNESLSGAAGGSGVVILRYVIPPPPTSTVIMVR